MNRGSKVDRTSLAESEARFRSLIELASDWYWEQDASLRFTHTSGAASDLSGHSTESTIGKTLWELEGITPLSGSWREHRALLAARKPFRDFEYRRIGPDARTFYASVSGSPVFDGRGRFEGYHGLGRSITERMAATQALRESEARFRSLVELSSDWYWKQDENLRFTYFSTEVTDKAAYEVRDRGSLGKTRWELAITPLSTSWPEHKALLAARQPFRDFEYSRVSADGAMSYVSVSGVPFFDAQGHFAGYQGIARNITERRRLERRLRQARHLESIGTLAGGIAHDFNNILGAILGYGEMALRDVPKGSRLHRDLDSIITAGERGRALVGRVLAFSRSGNSEHVAVQVEKVVREALDLIAAKLPPNITLHPNLDAGSAAMLGDPTQIHQLVMNLAMNAVHAMSSGGTLTISLTASSFENVHPPFLGTLYPGDYIALTVADTGTGIPSEIIERIFDPFFTTKDVGTGTGLGLSLVHGILAEVNGAIDVTSAIGVGSVFTVYLPRCGDAAQPQAQIRQEIPRGDGQRVLIVDDEEPLVELARRTLDELDYEPLGFTSSTAALAAFRADPGRFDAVITDERMPGLSGSALIREMRTIRDRIPILLMSGYVSGAAVARARKAGADQVLRKPLSARELAECLARAFADASATSR